MEDSIRKQLNNLTDHIVSLENTVLNLNEDLDWLERFIRSTIPAFPDAMDLRRPLWTNEIPTGLGNNVLNQ